MNPLAPARIGIVVLWALFAGGCLDGAGGHCTSLSFECEGCDATSMAAGEALSFELGWLGTAWSGGIDSATGPTCDPYQLWIECTGVACETTRNNPRSEFWSLEEAAAREVLGSRACSNSLDAFAVRPVEEGQLTLTLRLRNSRTDEQVSYSFGPIAVSPLDVQPRADCSGCEWDRVALGVPVDVRVAWDGQPGRHDPAGRQPFYLDLDCGEVRCEMRTSSSPEYAPLQRVVVPAQPASGGLALQVRATERGTMELTARLEHATSGESVSFELAHIDYHRIDGIEVLCLDGKLCGAPSVDYPHVVYGVVGLDAGTRVLVLPDVQYTSNVDDEPQRTTCSPSVYSDEQTGAGFACEGRLYVFGGATQYTIVADWMGSTASLTAPSP